MKRTKLAMPRGSKPGERRWSQEGTAQQEHRLGLCWLLEGAGVGALDPKTATLGHGRFCRLHAKFGSPMPSQGT